MKIKSDFVTNSSSACYIVHVPENFIIPDIYLKRYKESKYHNKKWIEKFKKAVDNFKNGKEYDYHFDEHIECMYYGLLLICTSV